MSDVNQLRSLAAEYMVSRAGKNSYTQGAKRMYFFGHPDNTPGNTGQKGYSDCSSAVRAAIRAAAGIDIGSNTSAQINNRSRLGAVVHQTDGYYPDESALEIGDCLYFKGNQSHPLDVGHVEMYIGGGKICGHGSGTGPKIRSMRDYCASRANSRRRYFMAIRWITGEGEIPERDLQYGHEGADVKILQQNLIALGYDLGVYGADGDFGAATRSALISFQENNGLSASGIADAPTRERIAQEMNAQGDLPQNQQGREEEDPVPPGQAVVIAPGSWNVRKGPGARYPSAGVVRGGDVLERVEPGAWIPVIFAGEVCFISPRALGG